MLTSSSTRLGRSRMKASTALTPFSASTASYFIACTACASEARTVAESSTIRIFCAMSVDAGSGFAHHLAPFLVLGAHEGRELLRPQRTRLHPRTAEAVLQLLVLQGLRGFGVQALDDVLRRTGGRRQVEPERGV